MSPDHDPYPIPEGSNCYITHLPDADPTSLDTVWVRARRTVMGSFEFYYESDGNGGGEGGTGDRSSTTRTPDRVRESHDPWDWDGSKKRSPEEVREGDVAYLAGEIFKSCYPSNISSKVQSVVEISFAIAEAFIAERVRRENELLGNPMERDGYEHQS